MLKDIKNFLNDRNQKKIILQYKGKRMNAACEWWKFRNPIRMIYRGLLNEIYKKLPPFGLKNSLYRLMGVKIGKDVVISPDVHVDPLFPELITIEDGVILGWGSKISTHEMLKDRIKLGRVLIKKNAVIGAYSLVRPGVTIGENSIVAVSSLANKDVKRFEVVGGIPIRKIK